MKWLLMPVRKVEQTIRRRRNAAALRRRKSRNFGAYKALDVKSVLDVCRSQPLYSLIVPVFRRPQALAALYCLGAKAVVHQLGTDPGR